MPFFYALVAVGLSWSAAIWLVYPALRPGGVINSRFSRGIQFAAYAATLVLGATLTHAITGFSNVDRWIAVPLLTVISWILAFFTGWIIGVPTSSLSERRPGPKAEVRDPGHDEEGSVSLALASKQKVASAERLETDAEEDWWAQAFAEFDSEERRAGVWARAYSEAQGDEAIAKANYLRIRALQLKQEQVGQEQLPEPVGQPAPLSPSPDPKENQSPPKPEAASYWWPIAAAFAFLLAVTVLALLAPSAHESQPRSAECRVTRLQADAIRRAFPDAKYSGTPISELSDQQLIDWICWEQRMKDSRQ